MSSIPGAMHPTPCSAVYVFTEDMMRLRCFEVVSWELMLSYRLMIA
jgi:hypothetical protein